MDTNAFNRLIKNNFGKPPAGCPDAVATANGWINPRTGALVQPIKGLATRMRLFEEEKKKRGYVDPSDVVEDQEKQEEPEKVVAPKKLEEPIKEEEIEEPVKEEEEVQEEPVKKSLDISATALKLAKKHDIDLFSVVGTGKDGKITKPDIDKLISDE